MHKNIQSKLVKILKVEVIKLENMGLTSHISLVIVDDFKNVDVLSACFKAVCWDIQGKTVITSIIVKSFNKNILM